MMILTMYGLMIRLYKIGKVVKEKAYNYYTADHLKAAVENNQDLTIVDIQVADEYKAHHIKGSVETNAYPVKTDEEKALLQPLLETIQASDAPVVIVCPRGGGGAERTHQYFTENNVDSSKLYILEGGQAGWPYAEMLEQ